jgi:hypothetical protein
VALLEKPFTEADLLSKVRAVLDKPGRYTREVGTGSGRI